MSQQRAITSQSLKKIMEKRVTIPASAASKAVKVYIQGDGNIIDVRDKNGDVVTSTIPGEEGTVLQKKIFNLKANSGVALTNAAVRQLIIDGLAAEKAGDVYKADELFTEYLNKTQMSFSVIIPNAVASRLGNNVQIAGQVQLITTDNGSLLTLDPSTVSVVEAETFSATEFNLNDFMAAEEPAEEEAGTAAEALTGGKKATGGVKAK